MVSRTRLLRLARTAAEMATTRRVRVVGQLLLVAALVFVVVRLRSIWDDSHIAFGSIDWPSLAAAFLITAAGVAAGGFVWLVILRRLGVETQRRWVGVYFQAQLSKYIPGAVWQYAGRATLARGEGIPVRPVGISLPIELAASALAAATTAPLLLGWPGVAVVGAAAAAIVIAGRRPKVRSRAVVDAAVRAWLYYLCSWLSIGVGFWLTARALVDISGSDVAVYAGAYGIAWLVGFVAVYAPGGLGVREAVLVALLAGRLGAADALVVAAVSRALLTLVDVVLAAVGFATLRDGARPAAVGVESGGSGRR